ncbi:MAG: undecaprenyldiphospho-muramoylpentapeptide beta-N-acetylglucosaminyltransferase [Clostridia bacterium]|nr:undecaprenyldiphospho-muramoylpentapeptide beta-N-acetylglucosaminyltransferase [Clostridia bacterium]
MNVVLSCAGTGGHIYPAIAIADKIRSEEPDAKILFIGTKTGMENRLVPAAGYEIRGIDASGFNRRNLLKNVKTARDLVKGGREAEAILREFQPDAVLGTGGYVTGPVVRKASKMGIPCFLHESNVVPGMANKMLEKYADGIFVSFEESREHFAHKERVVLTGNPIRRGFLAGDRAKARAEKGLSDEDFMVLVTGGSLGAQVLNLATVDLVRTLAASGRSIRVFFVTGRRYFEEVKALLSEIAGADEFVRLIDYADDMPVLMAAADLIVSRSGAIAMTEILASGKPSILIPSPNVTNNHQYYNAKSASDAGAAVLIEEKNMKDGYGIFTDAVLALSGDRDRLSRMANCAAKAGRKDAVDAIYAEMKRVVDAR